MTKLCQLCPLLSDPSGADLTKAFSSFFSSSFFSH